MFRFAIRDVLWLTVVVALAVGWGVDRSRLALSLDKAHAWRGRAGALESILRDIGFQLEWDIPSAQVCARGQGGLRCRSTESFEPTASE